MILLFNLTLDPRVVVVTDGGGGGRRGAGAGDAPPWDQGGIGAHGGGPSRGGGGGKGGAACGDAGLASRDDPYNRGGYIDRAAGLGGDCDSAGADAKYAAARIVKVLPHTDGGGESGTRVASTSGKAHVAKRIAPKTAGLAGEEPPAKKQAHRIEDTTGMIHAMNAGFQLYLDADNIRQSMEHLNEMFPMFTDLLNRIDTASAQAPEQQPRNIFDALGGPNPLPLSPLMHKFEAWHEVCRQILVQRARSPTTEKQRREQLENEAAVKASAKAFP